MTARLNRTGITFLALAGSVSLLGLNGCALIGDHVKSSFSCAAPDSLCAPTSSIDDRALAMITGEAVPAIQPTPAGPYQEQRGSRSRSSAARAAVRTPVRNADGRRTQEHLLRVVFQPYIDERGRLHEASALKMVVSGGQWSDDGLSTSASRSPDSPASGPSLAEALDGAQASAAVFDPNLPDPAVVAAARARAADPVGAIKTDVAAKLDKPKAAPTVTTRVLNSGTASPVPPKGQIPSSRTGPHQAAHAPIGAAPIQAERATGPGFIKPPPLIGTAQQASTAVKADPRVAGAKAEAEQGSRAAAVAAGAPTGGSDLKAKITAAGFPGAPTEGN